MSFFEWYLIWYLSGVIGICITTYYDSKHNAPSGHLLEYLFVSITGPIAFLYGLWVAYNEYRINNE